MSHLEKAVVTRRCRGDLGSLCMPLRVGATPVPFRCRSGSSSISITWEFVRNADFQAQFQTYQFRIYVSTRSPEICTNIKV